MRVNTVFDIRWIRENAEAFDKALASRGQDAAATKVIDLDDQRRAKVQAAQDLQNIRNSISKRIGQAKQSGEDVQPLMDEAATIAADLPRLEEEERLITDELNAFLARLPNCPADDVPFGTDESHNVEVRKWGTPREFPFEGKAHYDLGEALGMMDFEGAAKISGARFVILSGELAKLERALINFMIDVHTKEFGYLEVSPPYLVRTSAMYGSGQLPKFGEEAFQTTNEYWLVPTAEVPLTNMVADDILEEGVLPYRYVAHTPCFRSEAGSAGKDTRGMFRNHQFHKVELVSVTRPEESEAEHMRMLDAAQSILEKLEIPYRTILLCTGDMGPSSRKTYDIEAWLPGQNTYREISSCSNCGDYQARRMNARMRTADGAKKKTEFVHTLNGSGLAVGRTLIALVENYQCADGSIDIPLILQPYMGGQKMIKLGDSL